MPFTKILIKIFVRGFYKRHLGLLVFSICTFLLYGFFIAPLNQTHLTKDEITAYNLIVVLTLLENPFMLIVFYVILLVYVVKSAQYVLQQLKDKQNLFLRYSTTALGYTRQWLHWSFVQLLLLIPFLIYCIFSFLVGLTYEYYVASFVLVAFPLLVIAICGIIYTWQINKLSLGEKQVFSLGVYRWRKPIYGIFLYHIGDQLKIALLVTKLVVVLVFVVTNLLVSSEDVFVSSYIKALGIATAHSFLIYHLHQFKINYLGLLKNLPVRRVYIFFVIGLTYLIITLPEHLILLLNFDSTIEALGVILFGISIVSLYQVTLLNSGITLIKFIKIIFLLYVFYFFMVFFPYWWLAIPLNFLVAYSLFYRKYYQ